MRHLNHITLLTCGLATALAALALEATAQVPANMPSPDKADDQAKRLAENPFRRILEAGRVEVKLRREAAEAPAHAVAAPRRATAAAAAAPKPQAPRAAPGEAPVPAPAPAPLLHWSRRLPRRRFPCTGDGGRGRAPLDRIQRHDGCRGGRLHRGLDLCRKAGRRNAGGHHGSQQRRAQHHGAVQHRGGSQWAGVGIVLVSQRPVVATEYKALRVLLAGHTVGQLRLRLVGNDPAVQQRGCYPILMLPVKPQVTEYRIEFSQFAAPQYCGAEGVDVKSTLEALTAIEIADAPEPVGTAR
jgi:hypothetical protein